MRRKHSASFKTRAALEAIKGEETIVEISSMYSIHPTRWGNGKRKYCSVCRNYLTVKERNLTERQMNQRKRVKLASVPAVKFVGGNKYPTSLNLRRINF
jgi:transposase-like protein